MKRWTERHIRANEVIDAYGLDVEYENYKGWLNGGLDRTYFLADSLDEDNVAPSAFHNATVKVQQNLSLIGTSGGTYDFDALEYDDYPGGWVEEVSWDISGVKEGIIQLEWSCWAWLEQWNHAYNAKALRFALAVNKTLVCVGGKQFLGWQNTNLSVMVPTAGGTVNVGIWWKYTAPKTTGSHTDATGTSEMFYGGGTFLALSRWR